MIKKTANIPEHELHAYVDNQLDAERIQAVEAWLRAHPEDAEKVAAWKSQNLAISEYFDKDEYNRITRNLDVRALSQQHQYAYFKAAASVLLLLFAGLLGWYSHDYLSTRQIQDNQVYSFVEPAIAAYKVYSVDVKHPVEVTADKEQHLVTWLSKRLGQPLSTPDLSSLGYQLVGGRLLAIDKGPAAQFMFEDKEGKRITLFISNNPAIQTTAFRFKQASGVNSFYWVDKNLSYALSGELPRDELLDISHLIYQQYDTIPVTPRPDRSLIKS